MSAAIAYGLQTLDAKFGALRVGMRMRICELSKTWKAGKSVRW